METSLLEKTPSAETSSAVAPVEESDEISISCRKSCETLPNSDQSENGTEHILFNFVEDDSVEVSENEFFQALDLHQKTDEENTDSMNAKFEFPFENEAKDIVCENEVLCVDYEKPMPTRYSQNMDNIVAKIQNTTGEILTEEYLVDMSSESESENQTKPNVECKKDSLNNINNHKKRITKRNWTKKRKNFRRTEFFGVQNSLKLELENNNDNLYLEKCKIESSTSKKQPKTENEIVQIKEDIINRLDGVEIQHNLKKINHYNSSGISKNNNSVAVRMKMIRKIKQKLLSEKTRMLRSTKLYPVKKQTKKKTVKALKSRNKLENKPRIKLREKYLTEQEIETVKSEFKRLKEANSSLYSAFVKSDRNTVEILKADIVDPTGREQAKILQFLNSCRSKIRNTERIKQLKKNLKDPNLQDVPMEIVDSFKPPKETQLKIINNNIIHRSKTVIKRSEEIADFVGEESKKVGNRFNNPMYSYRRPAKLNNVNLKTYTKGRNHFIKNPEAKSDLNKDLLSIIHKELNGETRDEELNVESFNVVELEPLYNHKEENKRIEIEIETVNESGESARAKNIQILSNFTLQQAQMQNEYFDHETGAYSPFYDTEDDIEPKVPADAPLISRDPAMFQNEDYEEDNASTPLHNNFYEVDELSLASNPENVKMESSPENENDLEEPSLTSLQPVDATSLPSRVEEPKIKKSTLSAKIIRRAPIYQDAAKEETKPIEIDNVPSDTIFMSRDPSDINGETEEENDPYAFDDRDFTNDIKIEDTSDLLSELPRVIHNPKKKTCDKHGDRKARIAQVFPCSRCLYIGSNVHNLERHMLTHMDPENIIWYACDRCSYKTKYKHALKGHTDTHKEANNEKIFCCHLCNYKAHRKQNLNKHVYSSHNLSKEEMYQCYDCGKKFNTKAKLTNHINYMHSSSCEKCQFCNFVTPNKVSLAAHVKNKHGDVERLYFCQQCSFKSKFPRDLDKHILRMHNRDQMKKYDCTLCAFSTIYKSNMRYHMAHVHKTSIDEKTPPQFICGHCMKICNNKMALKGHIWQKHMTLSEDNYFKCDKCPFKSKVQRNLKRHVFLKHEQKGSKCPKCDFTTTRSSSMLAHMVAHKKENKSKIYRCNECVYIAYTVSTMIYHMKKFHNKIVSHAELKDYLK